MTNRNKSVPKVNRVLFDYGCGATGKYVLNQVLFRTDSTHDLSNTGFFKPFKKKKDLHRIYSPISAPITLGYFAAQCLINAAINALNILFLMFTFDDKDIILFYAAILARHVANTVILCVAAVLSPLLNLIDLVGSTVKTLAHKLHFKSEEDDSEFTDSDSDSDSSEIESSSLTEAI